MNACQRDYYEILKQSSQAAGKAGLSEKSLVAMAERVELVSYPKNAVLQEGGKVSKWMYQIASGIVREHVLREDGIDVSIMFHEAPVGTGSLYSYENNVGSLYSLSTVTPVSAHRMSCENLSNLLSNNTELSLWYAGLLRENAIKMQKHIIEMTCKSSEERLCYLISERPNLIKQVPSYQLATYLNMTPVSFSRSKSNIMKKKLVVIEA